MPDGLHQNDHQDESNRTQFSERSYEAYVEDTEREVPVESGLQMAAEILRREDGVFKHGEAVYMIHCQRQFCQV